MIQNKTDILNLIKSLSLARGTAGYEDEVIAVCKKALKTTDIQTDAIGNLYIGLEKAKKSGRPIVTFDGHSDEVGFMVQSINSNGTINIVASGGWVAHNVTAQLLQVQDRNGEWIPAVIGSTPPHFAKTQKEVTLQDLYLDVGASSAEELDSIYKIDLGAPVVPQGEFHYKEDTNIIMGKAFDNRLGCAGVIAIMNSLEDKLDLLPVAVVGVISSQEEVGLRGAKIASETVKADLAIIFEGTPADDRIKNSKLAQGVVGKGSQIRLRDNSMIAHRPYTQWVIDLCRREKLAHQVAVRDSGGTNGGSYSLSASATPSCVIATPVRYAHTPYCFSSVNDFESMLQIGLRIIENLDVNTMQQWKNRF